MDRYSRTVAILKVFLPLAALAILSTLFLLSRSKTPTATIPFAENEVESRMAGQQITGPHFSGVTASGDEILISAQTASPGVPGEPAHAEWLNARITTKDGIQIVLTSDTGTVAMDKDVVTFEGNVVIVSTNGYEITTDTLNASLSVVAGSTPGRIDGTSPMGHFTAGNMELRSENEDGPLHLLFKNGVKLVYEPQRPE
ncbi:LPS export ABC transporter periplasmic protein LptC [Phaeobacter marinintestinus]|uniref:LPS export ABC transporter periplasmic protein LptC n=1 Tax=Falsiphaeobacter marinintestinus TaxID=1492905 RepID=UPI0011B840DB|nr:LPS export ABC transporter periplasmic protein LptC [Phaeobacter marinintestinus]